MSIDGRNGVRRYVGQSDGLPDHLCAGRHHLRRIYYVAFEWGYYSQHPNEIIAIWKGGIAIYGAVIGVVIALAVYSRIKKLSFASLCDLAAFGLLIGQCIGRWGNFVNGEAHGGATSLPWGMSIERRLSRVHPTFLI